MDWMIIAIIAGAALVCPAMMLGPMLLQRLGSRNGASAMSCIPMFGHDRRSVGALAVLRRRRTALDEEIAVTVLLARGAARRGRPVADSPVHNHIDGGEHR